MSDALLPNRFLFRFSLPCQYSERLWMSEDPTLDERYRLTSFAELEQQPAFAEVRVAWNNTGVAFTVLVEGKRQAPWCRASRPEDSDSFQVWIDTRDVRNVHRASRFCHRFIFLPSGAGQRLDEPSAQWLPIHRAREQPKTILSRQLQVRGQQRNHDYVLHAFVAAEALTGFDPIEHPHLGFNYAVIDRELGVQTLTVGSPMPYQEDPSLWATLELVQ
jgi:hypothetical protein